MLDTSHCQAYFDEVVAKAKELGLYEPPPGEKKNPDIRYLKNELDYLDNYRKKNETACILFKDLAPLSFGIMMYMRKKEDFDKPWSKDAESEGLHFMFNGGLIFHGQHDRGGDGGAPTFSVSLTATNGWQVHT
jgi:hypothetical protein